ncbi:MAG TPA: hypothetical protein VMV97_09395 [Sulfuriferula sp.]|nr:hypothetical protein [Sulfuriferula sp.]
MFPIPVFDIESIFATDGLRTLAAKPNPIGQTERIQSRTQSCCNTLIHNRKG